MLRAIDRHCQPFLAHTVLPSAFLFIFHNTTPSIKQKERVDKRPNIINMQHSIPYDVIQYVIIRMNVSKFVAKTRVFYKTIFSQFTSGDILCSTFCMFACPLNGNTTWCDPLNQDLLRSSANLKKRICINWLAFYTCLESS